MNKISKTGFTKTGFSKAGFGACSHWNECGMGKNKCYYQEIDPEVMEYCACYQNNHRKRNKHPSIKTNITREEVVLDDTEKEQLSLF